MVYIFEDEKTEKKKVIVKKAPCDALRKVKFKEVNKTLFWNTFSEAIFFCHFIDNKGLSENAISRCSLVFFGSVHR